MLGHEIHHNHKIITALAPVAVTATTNGLTIDRQNFETMEFAIQTGVVTSADATNFLTASLEESNTVDGSGVMTSGTAVAAADLLGSAPVINNTTTKASTLFKVGYRGYKRYVRLVFTETLTFSGLVSAMAELGRPRDFPVA